MSSPTPHLALNAQEDLHMLLAFASKLIGKKLATPNEVLRNGIRPVDDQATNKRPLPILDAIAALSVFQESGQVVAIALQMDQHAKTICLTIAENRRSRVQPRVVAQIDGIWKILQSLSDEYCRLRSVSHRVEDSQYQGDRSPEPPIAPQPSEARLELVRLVYTFCWKKMRVRIGKWWPCLDSLSMTITSFLYIEHNEDQSGLMNKLLGAVVMFRTAFPMIQHRPDQSFSIVDWGVFSDRMDTAIEKVVEILRDEEHCEIWGKRFKEGKNDIPVRRALEKLTSLHRYIDVLVRFANSPRLRPVLTYRLILNPVTPPLPRQVALPPTADDWQPTVDYVCAGNALATDDWTRTQAIDLAKHYSSSYLCSAHCECSLIAHLEATHTAGTKPAFGYIGVSKLSCCACMLWIAAFNRRGGRRYFTRGTHGKWDWPWTAPPPGLGPDEAGMMAKAVRAECVRFIKASGYFWSGEDGLVEKGPRRGTEVAKKMDMEIEGGIESMLRKLKSSLSHSR